MGWITPVFSWPSRETEILMSYLRRYVELSAWIALLSVSIRQQAAYAINSTLNYGWLPCGLVATWWDATATTSPKSNVNASTFGIIHRSYSSRTFGSGAHVACRYASTVATNQMRREENNTLNVRKKKVEKKFCFFLFFFFFVFFFFLQEGELFDNYDQEKHGGNRKQSIDKKTCDTPVWSHNIFCFNCNNICVIDQSTSSKCSHLDLINSSVYFGSSANIHSVLLLFIRHFFFFFTFYDLCCRVIRKRKKKTNTTKQTMVFFFSSS